MSKNDERWLARSVMPLAKARTEALKAHVLETGHFPNNHDKRLNWAKLQMKKALGCLSQ